MENTLGFRSTTEEVKHLIMMFMGTEEKEVERRVLVKHTIQVLQMGLLLGQLRFW